MRVNLPKVSVVAFVVSTLSFVVYWLLASLQGLIGQSLTNALQNLDSLIGVGSFIIGVAAIVSDYFNELPPPPTIRNFVHIFPEIDNDTAEILREPKPHRVDFEEDLVVLPHNIGGLILKKIGVRIRDSFGVEISKKNDAAKVGTGLVAGPSGCGKSTTVLRLCFELLKSGWRIYYSDVADLFTASNISEIRNWIRSLRKRNLIVLDNIHTNRSQTNSLLDTIEDLHKNGLIRLRSKIRLLCIETRAHAIDSTRRDRDIQRIDGKRIFTVPMIATDIVGLGLTETKTSRPSGDLIGRVPTLFIQRGEDVAKLLVTRFLETTGMESELDFNKIFSVTGNLVEFCEVLKWIKENSGSADDELDPGSISRVAEIALERRLKVVDDKETGVLVLGLISSFSQAGSVVSSAFLESIAGRTLSSVTKELLEAQHLLEILVGPAQKQFLIYTHAELARLLRVSCAPVLQDLISTDSDIEVDLKLYDAYLDHINSLPPRSSKGIASTFILVLSSHASLHELGHIADFVIEKGTTWTNPDVNIKYSLYNVGQFYFKMGEFEKAEQILRTVLSIDDQFIEARGNLGALLLFQGKLEQAREQYEIAIQQKPDDALLHANLSQILWEEGETSMALQSIQQASELAADVGRYRYNLGKMLAALDRMGDALPHLKEAIKLNPEDVEYYVGLSHVLIGLGEIDAAEKTILEAVSRNLESPMLFNNHGVILKKKGDVEEAIAKFEMALALNPSFGLSLANLGECFFLKNDLETAEEKTRAALKLEPEQGKIHALYGQILHRQKRYGDSIEAFEKSIALEFSPPEIYANLVVAYYELGRFDESDAAMQQILEISKDPDTLRIRMALFYISKGDFKRARRNLTEDTESFQSVKTDPNYLNALRKLADSSLSKRNLVVAEWALEKLSLLQPDLFMIWSNLGIAQAGLKKLDAAKTALQKAAEIEPNNPVVWHNLGNVLKELGDTEESTKAYERARQLGIQQSKEDGEDS